MGIPSTIESRSTPSEKQINPSTQQATLLPTSIKWWEKVKKHNPTIEDKLNLANPATAVGAALSSAQQKEAAKYSNLGFVLSPHLAKKWGVSPKVVKYKVQKCLDYITTYLPTAKEEMEIFGIPCRCANYTDDDKYDMFRIFKTPWYSFREHSKLLTGKRYRHLLKLEITDYKNWAHGLQSAGYATNKKYAKTLISVIEKLNLNKYDENK